MVVKLSEVNLALVFSHYDDEVTFPLKIVNKRNITLENQVDLLNDYLNFKGVDYQTEVFNLLKEIHHDIIMSSSSKLLERIPTLDKLIEIIDVDDIKDYIINIKKIRIPKTLIKEFSDEIKDQGKWSQEQTYTVEDYKNLTAEAIRLKLLLGPLNFYYYINSNKFQPIWVEYTLVTLLLDKIVESSKAVHKVKAMVGKLITGIDFKAVIIDKNLGSDKLDEYVTSIIMLQRIATATIITDNESKNLITTIYSYGYNKLTISGDISKIIRDKISVTKEETETASVIENYKAVTKVTPGDLEEINWVTEDIPFAVYNSPKFLSENCDIKNIDYKVIDIFKDDSISDFTRLLTKVIFKKTINSASIENLPIENMLNLILIGHEFLIEIGYKDIADLYVSRELEYNEISLNTIRKRDKVLISKLEEYFFNGEGEMFIKKLIDKLMIKNWVNYNGMVKIPENIYNDLASLFITIEENYNK